MRSDYSLKNNGQQPTVNIWGGGEVRFRSSAPSNALISSIDIILNTNYTGGRLVNSEWSLPYIGDAQQQSTLAEGRCFRSSRQTPTCRLCTCHKLSVSKYLC